MRSVSNGRQEAEALGAGRGQGRISYIEYSPLSGIADVASSSQSGA